MFSYRTGPFLVVFFSATIDGRNLIFGHKLYVGTPYRGSVHLIQCNLEKNKMNCELMLTYDTPAPLQTGNGNLTGQKTLPRYGVPTYDKLRPQILSVVSTANSSLRFRTVDYYLKELQTF
jgi:hypothetical protein